MSVVSLSSVLNDARGIVTKLHDQDKVTDMLLSQANSVNEQVLTMKQYQEELQVLNQLNHQRPRSQLVLSLQKENRQIRALQMENGDLRQALEAHQTALELIMNKYRAQMLRFSKLRRLEEALARKIDGPEVASSSSGSSGCAKDAKFAELASAFAESLRQGEQQANREETELIRLRTENTALREMLRLADRGSDPGVSRDYVARLREVRDQLDAEELLVMQQASNTSRKCCCGDNATPPVSQPAVVQELQSDGTPTHSAAVPPTANANGAVPTLERSNTVKKSPSSDADVSSPGRASARGPGSIDKTTAKTPPSKTTAEDRRRSVPTSVSASKAEVSKRSPLAKRESTGSSAVAGVKAAVGKRLAVRSSPPSAGVGAGRGKTKV